MNLKSPWPSNLHSLRSWQLAQLRTYLRETVLPFSARYGALFRREGLDPRQLRSPDDLQRIPFTSKSDFLPGVNGSDPVRDFVLQPDRAVLARRPSTIVRALLRGKQAVADGFEREFRPLLLTSTTGRSADPVPFVYTAHDIDNLRHGGARVYDVCAAKREMRMVCVFPFAPHLAFWLTHYGGTEFNNFVISSGGREVRPKQSTNCTVGQSFRSTRFSKCLL